MAPYFYPPYTVYAVALLYHEAGGSRFRLLSRTLIEPGDDPLTGDQVTARARGLVESPADWGDEHAPLSDWRFTAAAHVNLVRT